MEVTFFFDPACPWTWRTARWLLTVAPSREVIVRWRAFSLAMLHEGGPPEPFRAVLAASGQALRLVEALRADNRHDDISRFYTELGTRSHQVQAPLSAEIVLAAAEAAELTDVKRIIDDPAWDEAVRESHDTAMASAGPDIGSPVLMLDGAGRGLHGPVLAESYDEAEALRIWDAIVPLLHSSAFFEVKRGRH